MPTSTLVLVTLHHRCVFIYTILFLLNSMRKYTDFYSPLFSYYLVQHCIAANVHLINVCRRMLFIFLLFILSFYFYFYILFWFIPIKTVFLAESIKKKSAYIKLPHIFICIIHILPSLHDFSTDFNRQCLTGFRWLFYHYWLFTEVAVSQLKSWALNSLYTHTKMCFLHKTCV